MAPGTPTGSFCAGGLATVLSANCSVLYGHLLYAYEFTAVSETLYCRWALHKWEHQAVAIPAKEIIKKTRCGRFNKKVLRGKVGVSCVREWGNQWSTSQDRGEDGSALQYNTLPYASTLNLAGSNPAFLHSQVISQLSGAHLRKEHTRLRNDSSFFLTLPFSFL